MGFFNDICNFQVSGAFAPDVCSAQIFSQINQQWTGWRRRRFYRKIGNFIKFIGSRAASSTKPGSLAIENSSRYPGISICIPSRSWNGVLSFSFLFLIRVRYYHPGFQCRISVLFRITAWNIAILCDSSCKSASGCRPIIVSRLRFCKGIS